METLRLDLRYALRSLVRQRGVTATILVTLALGIGATTAVFSVVYAVLLRPLPYAEPDRLAMIWEKRPAEGVTDNVVSPADYLDWARLSSSFTGMAAYSAATADLTGSGEPVQLQVGGVTAQFFEVLGVRPALGRTFEPGEDILGRHRVVVLSHAIWQQRFGGDPQIVGRQIVLNGLPQEVIGVLRRDFEFPGEAIDLWAPVVLQGGSEPPPRASHFLMVYARLRGDRSIEAARADLDSIGATLAREYPAENRNHFPNVVPLREEIVGPARGGLLVVMSAVAFLLLIACTNVATLLLARSAGRRREMAIRLAVGAAKARLLRQALTESVLLAGLGGVLGLLVAEGMLRLLVAETPPLLSGAGLERARLDVAVLLFAAAVCLITGLLAGALPAWQAARQQPADPMRDGGRSPLSLRRGVRFGLITVEVGLSVVLLIGAGLLLRSFVRVLSEPAGIETANRITIALTLPRSRYPDPEAIRRARRDLDERLKGIPGVIAAGANNNFPLTASDSRRGIVIQGQENREGPTRAHTRIVTVDYFKAAGIVLTAGRTFSSADRAQAPLVIVINDTMARRYWPGQAAVGSACNSLARSAWREVVGVIADVKHWGLDREVNPELYMPHDQQPSASLTYVLHTSVAPASIAEAVTSHVHAVDPNLPAGALRTLDEIAATSVAARRWSAVLLGIFALLGVVLAGAGIYGVMAHVVSMRTGEIAVRMSLGARPASVMRQVLGEAMAQTAVGLGVGLLVAYLSMRTMKALLFNVGETDPAAFAAATVTVLTAALLAATLPAVRAMRVDPVRALREP